MQTEIKQFVRGSKNERRGILMAVKMANGSVTAGFALCNKKDTFNREFGEAIAKSRALSTRIYRFPRSIDKRCMEFQERIKKYFKVDAVHWGSEVLH